jgi:hypothetical protein
MSETGNSVSFSAGTASSVQQMSSTMQVTTFFSCTHSETSTVAYTTSTAPVQVSDGPCNNTMCQAAKPSTFPTIASYNETESSFVSKLTSQLQLAGMSGERCLGKFNLVEPQTQADLVEAGCSPLVVTALLQCGATTSSSATASFLGHRNVQSVLKQFEACVQNNGMVWQADILCSQLNSLNAGVQQRLAELDSAVKHLTINSHPAPGANFKMIEGINSYEKSYGKAELAALRSTPQGQSVLSLPLNNANILAAKTSIRDAMTSFSASQATAGASQSDTNTFAAESISSSAPTIDLHSAVNGNISALCPMIRVYSKVMAKTSLSINLAIAQAHSGKSYAQLTKPWWAAREA